MSSDTLNSSKSTFYWLEKMLKDIFPQGTNFAEVSSDYARLKKVLQKVEK